MKYNDLSRALTRHGQLSSIITFNPFPSKMTGLITKKKYTVTLELEVWDDTHPEDFDWESMLDLQHNEEVKVKVEEEEIW